ncbi:MAG: hypothetical protein LBK91_03215 [Synergistaceae bacterium]|jgi:hypothetical protein|nr:hypothetical protein [Synergistaceae bacterium]
MRTLEEIFLDRGFRRPLFFCFLAAAAWVLCLAFAVETVSLGGRLRADIVSSGRVVDYAAQFRALPRSGPAEAIGDPLGVLSQIVDALGLRDRLRQLQSNASGAVIQLDGLYGAELRDLLGAAEKRGLFIRTAEIRALPGEGGRVLSVTIMVEPSE